MRNLLLFIFSAFTAIALKAQTPSIEALRTCAAEKGIPPKEYIFKLFEKSDIVVLGERDHRDTGTDRICLYRSRLVQHER